MSRYFGGKTKLTEEILLDIEDNVKVNIYDIILSLGTVSEWNVVYGYDHACMYFIQFEKITIDDFEGEQVVDIDYLFDGLNGKEIAYLLRVLLPKSIMAKSHSDLAYMDCGF